MKILTTLALVLVMAISATPAIADTSVHQEQELEQELEVKCTAGAYGQDSTCEAKGKQYGKQSQTVTLQDGTEIAVHQPINTGLDVQTAATAAGVIATGVISFVVRQKFTI